MASSSAHTTHPHWVQRLQAHFHSGFEAVSTHIAALGFGLCLLLELLGHISVGRWRVQEALKQAARLGVQSLPMVLALNWIIGAVLSLQVAERFAQNGAEAYVGGLIGLAVVREIAPVFTAMAVGARAGTAMASELANMAVREQVDALRVLHMNPVRFLGVPRFLAAVLSVLCLTVVSGAVAVLSGLIVAQVSTELTPPLFLESLWLSLRPFDVWVCLLKALCFGATLAVVCLHIGLNAKGGARQVGRSATLAAVWTALWVVVLDFMLSWFFYVSGLVERGI